jgi:DNA-binding transcriptional LysR family regulator
MIANHIGHNLMRNMHMNFSQLQSFVALAETGSFTEAAYAIDLTQSAVSHALSALESELGVTLLKRNRKGVVALTDAGQKIIPHVRALLAQVEAIEQEAKAAHGEAAGKLRLGSMLSIVSPALLARVLTCFRASYPDIEVVLFEGTMREVGEWIEKSIIDVGFVLFPAQGIEVTPITTDELCVLVPPGHRLHTKVAVTPRDLQEEGWIMEKNQCALQLMEVAVGPSRVRPQIRYQASDSATILAMIREGLGITLMPRMVLPKKLEGVVALPLDPPHQLQIGLAVRSQAMASPAAQLFVQTASIRVQESAFLHP